MNPIRIMIVAVGGQGNIFVARMLGETAVATNTEVRMSEFHGMAQRGGVVESMVLLGGGKSYCIADGQADVLLGFEPAETIRAAGKCGSQSLVITNTSELPPFTVALGKARYPDIPDTLSVIAGRVKKLIAIDATSLALRAGSSIVMNVVMLGAFVGTNALPMSPVLFENSIKKNTKKQFLDMNLKAFELGMQAVTGSR
jgi:indolepyruvate ferredoxin oxidoreductase beta subunit